MHILGCIPYQIDPRSYYISVASDECQPPPPPPPPPPPLCTVLTTSIYDSYRFMAIMFAADCNIVIIFTFRHLNIIVQFYVLIIGSLLGCGITKQRILMGVWYTWYIFNRSITMVTALVMTTSTVVHGHNPRYKQAGQTSVSHFWSFFEYICPPPTNIAFHAIFTYLRIF